jgi:hypothetical protein
MDLAHHERESPRRAVEPSNFGEGSASVQAEHEGNTEAIDQVGMSSLGLAFPELAELLQLDGVPLWQIELGDLTYEELTELSQGITPLVKAEEQSILSSIPSELRLRLSRDRARELAARSPESYFVRDRSVRAENFSDVRYVELTQDLSQKLIQLSDLTVLIAQQPAYFEGVSAGIARSMEVHSGEDNVFIDWEWIEHQQQWVGYDIAGAEVAHIPMPPLGKP